MDYARELLICMLTWSLAFERYDDGLCRMIIEEAENFVDKIAEVLIPCQGDGKDAMDEDKAIFVGVVRVLGLHANIEEANAIVQLFAGRD
jgi:hypothetical protein